MSTATISTANPAGLTHTTTSTATSSIADSPLFKLPPELRLRIYEYAVYSEDDDGKCKVTREHGIPEPPLLFTCKTVRGEAISSFYSVNNFHNIVELLHPATIVLTMRKKNSLLAQGERFKGRFRVSGPHSSLTNDAWPQSRMNDPAKIRLPSGKTCGYA
jgi:hypothetical protein